MKCEKKTKGAFFFFGILWGWSWVEFGLNLDFEWDWNWVFGWDEMGWDGFGLDFGWDEVG